MTKTADESDLLNELLSLEDSFYQEGLELGTADGGRAGHVEGMVFGLEKGFEAYLELGMLHGRALVWSHGWDFGTKSSLGDPQRKVKIQKSSAEASVSSGSPISKPSSSRLERNIELVLSSTNPDALSYANTEEAIANFEDRLKKASAKSKIIEKSKREIDLPIGSQQPRPLAQPDKSGGNIEDISATHARH